VFFAVVGAKLEWDVLKSSILVAAGLMVVRGGSLYLGSRVGMKMGGVPEEQRKFLHFALYSQSGIAIGLAILLAKHFGAPTVVDGVEKPGWGAQAAPYLLGGIILNEMLGPVLFKTALIRSGEAGKRAAVTGGH